MTINLNRNTKIMLALAGVVMVGLFLWSGPRKRSFLGFKPKEKKKPKDTAVRPAPATRPNYPTNVLPYGKVSSGSKKDWVVFFKNPRGVIYLPPGTQPYQSRGTWYVDLGGEAVAMTGPGAAPQYYVNTLFVYP